MMMPNNFQDLENSIDQNLQTTPLFHKIITNGYMSTNSLPVPIVATYSFKSSKTTHPQLNTDLFIPRNLFYFTSTIYQQLLNKVYFISSFISNRNFRINAYSGYFSLYLVNKLIICKCGFQGANQYTLESLAAHPQSKTDLVIT